MSEASPPIAFTDLPLSPALLAVVADLGFTALTPIQAQAIPALIAGQDLVGQSKTGSGKTAAYALPILNVLDLAKREVVGVVVCPTRELSAQVARELRKLGRNLAGLTVVVLAGGEAVRDQTRVLEKGVHVVVGTPGRILDHLQRRTLKVHRVATVVLDEADRMLDMGFQEDVSKILKALPPKRQTVFFSATFPDSIRALSTKYQKEPVHVRIDDDGDETAARTKELVVHVGEEQKRATLSWLLARYPHESALVFANLKVTVA